MFKGVKQNSIVYNNRVKSTAIQEFQMLSAPALFSIIFTVFLVSISMYLFKKYKKKDDICAICYDDTSKHQCTKLDCNHEFHSHCIVEWFRRGNSTCPYCISTGKKESETRTNVNNIMRDANIINRGNEWEFHEDVQLFLNTGDNDYTHEIITNAYYRRDLHFAEINNYADDHTYNWIVNKLGLSNELIDKQIKQVYRNRINNEINSQLINVFNNEQINMPQNNFNNFYEEQINSDAIISKKEKYRLLTENMNSGDTRDLYRCLDTGDLYYLGW